jgi:hypothetical protein
MPGWYIHLDVARTAALLLGEKPVGKPAPDAVAAALEGDGPTPAQLAEIIRKYPNYYALGAIGPDIFFLLPDFKGEVGNFIAQVARWVVDTWNDLDENVFEPWEKYIGPIEEDQTETVSRLTGDLSNEISRVAGYASGIIRAAVLGFLSRLYDWFGIFGCGVPQGYDDKLFFWSDMFHYRLTDQFARDLFTVASTTSFSNDDDASESGTPGEPYEPGIAFALGWMTHIGTDVAGHAFVNEKAGGPYRLHWQRHHLVENHMDAFVYDREHGTEERYNNLHISALHFWLQFDDHNDYQPQYGMFDLDKRPQYPTGLRSRDYFDRDHAFDIDSTLPPGLRNFLLTVMEKTFVAGHGPQTNGGMPTHPMILAAITNDPTGRPDAGLLDDTVELLFDFVKRTTTDYYKMPKPQPPEVFPNLDPPTWGDRDGIAPSGEDDDGSFWDWLLAIVSFVLYLVEWVEYIVTILPALILDLATYPVRYLLYLIEEALYELWLAFHQLLVMEGFVAPRPEEIDLGLVTLGMPAATPFLGLLGLVDDVFGGIVDAAGNVTGIDVGNPFANSPNPPQPQPVPDPKYPRLTVTDDPVLLQKLIALLKGRNPSDPQPSEFLRPWEYPFLNNAHQPIGSERPLTAAGPFPAGADPTILLAHFPGSDAARRAYEVAPDPATTDQLNQRLGPRFSLGDPVSYSLYTIGRLTRDLEGERPFLANFNLDSDRGYGYRCWDWDRRGAYTDGTPTEGGAFTATYAQLGQRYPQFQYVVPCTPPSQWDTSELDPGQQAGDPSWVTPNGPPPSPPNPPGGDSAVPVALHYLHPTDPQDDSTGPYPGCSPDTGGGGDIG